MEKRSMERRPQNCQKRENTLPDTAGSAASFAREKQRENTGKGGTKIVGRCGVATVA